MPFRSPTTSGFGGFGATNPTMRIPYRRGTGSLLYSDIYQALGPEYFERRPTAGATPAPSPTVAPATANNVGGVVNPHLFGNESNRGFWERPRDVPNRPHEAMTFDGPPDVQAGARIADRQPIGGEATGIREYPSGGGRSPAFADNSDAWIGAEPVRGQPTVETPTLSPNQSGSLAGEPSLFDNASLNPFDQWWRTSSESVPSVTVNAGDSGGSIWAGDETLSNFGNDVALGSDLNADLGSLGYGEGYPVIDAPTTEAPFNPVAEGTGIPVELNQDVGDLVYTTSPDDRRFLPGSEESSSPGPSGPVNTVSGVDIRNFGGQRFNDTTGLSLGAFLNAPLSDLRFGEGYRIPFGGRPSDLQPGEDWISPGADTAGHWVEEPGGQRWVEDAPRGTGEPSTGDTGGSVHDNAASNNTPIPGDVTPPSGMRIIGYDTHNGQPIYEDSHGNRFVNPGTGRIVDPTHGLLSPGAYDRATFGGVTPTGYRDTRGSAASDSRAENAALMDAVRGWGFSAPYRTQADMPSSFSLGTMRLDSEGGFEQVANGRVGRNLGPGVNTSGSWWANHVSRPAQQPTGAGTSRGG